MPKIFRFPALLLLAPCLVAPELAAAQSASLAGIVQDPSGAVVPSAAISLIGGGQTANTTSGPDGHYAFRQVAPGTYALTATAKGFSPLRMTAVEIASGQSRQLNLSLTIAVEQQDVLVTGQTQSVSIEADHNAGAMVVKGSDLDALSDDPTELQNELQALAGPAAGPNGGQIYIDGFEGGQLPPKSSILEIRVNQNPFSAEYDRIGYGRVEIITKPGSAKLKGSINSYGNASAFDTGSPLVSNVPGYYFYSYSGDISGPITKTASFFFNGYEYSRQVPTLINGLNPATLNSNLNETFPAPFTYLELDPRVDFQLSKNNFISIRESFSRRTSNGGGVGTFSLPEQATNSKNNTNDIQVGDTWVITPNLLMEPRFEWRRIRNDLTSSYFTPTVTVQGAFTAGGANSGNAQDHQDIFALQDYATATLRKHTLRFGLRVRSLRDANYSTAGQNGSYFFPNVAAYQAGKPSLYSATIITNPVARVLLVDAAAFLQDDWRVSPRVLLGLGVRYDGQNRIHDHADVGPRVALAWTPARPGKTQPKTVVRLGYGWFSNRFTIPNNFTATGATPYIIEAIHDNLINQRTYTVQNPAFYDPTAAEPESSLASSGASTPTYHSIDPHFHAAIDMQAGVGVDHAFGKHITSNVTYLYTQGVHQYYTNNVTAPAFNVTNYTITGARPAAYNYQFQSGGFYRQNQLIFSSGLQLKKLTVTANYVLNYAKSDTQGVNSFPSVPENPGFDYGRAGFDIRNRITLLESYTAPHGIVFASLFTAQSGTPYNFTIGEDLTGSNQFNARPAIGTCGAAGVVSTQYGCLDTDPIGKSEPILPFDAGTGPVNYVWHVRVSKVIGIGPRLKTEGEGQTYNPNGGGGVGGRGISSGGPSIRLDAAAPRRYNLTFVVGANNALNIVNWGTPNGVLLSPLFNKTQTLAGGSFGSPVPGNRTVTFQTTFSF